MGRKCVFEFVSAQQRCEVEENEESECREKLIGNLRQLLINQSLKFQFSIFALCFIVICASHLYSFCIISMSTALVSAAENCDSSQIGSNCVLTEFHIQMIENQSRNSLSL